jgi:tripartite-type tricarboxylate transporter receptor subunit TctC
MTVTRRGALKTGTASLAAVYLSAPHARAEAWPSRPIKIVCAFLAGGLADLFARAYGEYLSQKLGQPVVVENRAGASGSIAAQVVKLSPPDGYTLLVAITATLAQNRVLYKNLPYDSDKDFVRISYMPSGHLPFVAGKTTKASNLEEFIAYARKNETNVGAWGAGSLCSHRCCGAE